VLRRMINCLRQKCVEEKWKNGWNVDKTGKGRVLQLYLNW
jgi:hypothetical protein